MAQSGTNLPVLYAELNQFGQTGEYDKALKSANKILQAAPDESKAFHCKVVSQIQLGRFEDALAALRKHSELARELVFEKAYCEYRLNRTDEALRTLESAESQDERTKELQAQVYYRLERYSEAFTVYRDLIKNTQDDFEDERETNLSAVVAALQMWNQEDVEDLGMRDDTYELCYNAACAAIGRKEYKEALEKLERAEVLCREMFEDDADVTEEDVMVELAVIKIQMGYVLQLLGKNDEAMKHYNAVIKQRPSDISLAAVTSNNIITINKDQNVFESQKRIKALTADGLQQKLTSLQRQALTLNLCLFYLMQNKNDQCRKSLQMLHKMCGDKELPALVEAALLNKEKNATKATDVLKRQSEDGSLHVSLALAQLFLTQGKVYQACDTLKALDDTRHQPGMVSALVALYLGQEDWNAASDVLNDAVTWYKQNDPRSPDLVLLMRANANFQLRHGDPQSATRVLEDLRKQDPSDLKTLAQLISAYSKFDPQKAQVISRDLPPPTNIADAVDIDSLEASASLLGPRYIKKATKVEQTPPTPTSPKKKKVPTATLR